MYKINYITVPRTPSYIAIIRLKKTIIDPIINKFYSIIGKYTFKNDFYMFNVESHGALFIDVSTKERQLCLNSLTKKQRKILLFYRQIKFHTEFDISYKYKMDNHYYGFNIYEYNNYSDDFYNIHYRNNDSNIVPDKSINDDMNKEHYERMYLSRYRDNAVTNYCGTQLSINY